MGRIVIVAYRPLPGKSDELEELCRSHHARLAAEGLVTDRNPILMRTCEGTIIEVFEWVSSEAIASAHGNSAVAAMWSEYAACSDYVPLSQLPECQSLFAQFDPFS